MCVVLTRWLVERVVSPGWKPSAVWPLVDSSYNLSLIFKKRISCTSHLQNQRYKEKTAQADEQVTRNINSKQDCKGVLSTDHKATIIDGKAIADKIKQEIATEVGRMKSVVGKVPGLAVVLVGTRRDSESYVCNKKIACAEAGIASSCTELPENTSEEEVLNIVKKYNDDPSVHGVLVQLPLPQHINEERILSAVSIEKDVDGFHPLNIGNLTVQGKEPLFVPCTAKACIELLLGTGITLTGRHAVVIGCSNIVGLPASLLLQRHNVTVTVVHALTVNPEAYTRTADIVISAAGSPNLVRGYWLKPDAVVLDVGINYIQSSTSSREFHLVGDVCFEEACKVASAVSPVPGGVGPVTIAMLLQNTLESAKSTYGLSDF